LRRPRRKTRQHAQRHFSFKIGFSEAFLEATNSARRGILGLSGKNFLVFSAVANSFFSAVAYYSTYFRHFQNLRRLQLTPWIFFRFFLILLNGLGGDPPPGLFGRPVSTGLVGTHLLRYHSSRLLRL
jgi:hypothetical protein